MGMSKRTTAYADVHAVFMSVLENDGGSLRMETHGKAVHFRQRAHFYRNLVAAHYPQFDMIKINVDPDIGKITFTVVKSAGQFLAPDGKEKDIDVVIPSGNGQVIEGFDNTNDSLLDETLDLVRRKSK